MNESLYLNKICFQKEEESSNATIFCLSLIISFFFLLSCILEIQLSIPAYVSYDSEKNVLIMTYEFEKINDLLNFKEIQIEDQNFPFQIQNISEILRNEFTNKNFQNIELSSPCAFRNNQVLQIKLLDKRDKVIKKIFRLLMKEGI
ncbi:MAG: hypothetical protein HFI09_04335 [Bacilli bacterium]|nr:hypothetical protein [Bacilli bacterium]